VKSNWLVFFACLILPMTLSAQVAPPAQGQAAPTPDPEPLARDFSEAQVIALGKQIYEQDQRVDVATNLARANGVDFAAEKVRGWVVVRDKTAERIRFVREENGALVNAFETAFVAGAPPQFRRLAGEALGPAEMGQFRARMRAMSGVFLPCSKLYAFLVFDHPQMDAFLIYAIAKPTEPGAIVVGGHYRFAVSRDGDRGLTAERLFRTCVTLSANAPDMDKSKGILITHLASMRPTETQVYLSLFNQMPVIVHTPDGIVWKVDGLRIDPVGKR
jgi:hypothetical protein